MEYLIGLGVCKILTALPILAFPRLGALVVGEGYFPSHPSSIVVENYVICSENLYNFRGLFIKLWVLVKFTAQYPFPSVDFLRLAVKVLIVLAMLRKKLLHDR